jgi:hypothetical protein
LGQQPPIVYCICLERSALKVARSSQHQPDEYDGEHRCGGAQQFCVATEPEAEQARLGVRKESSSAGPELCPWPLWEDLFQRGYERHRYYERADHRDGGEQPEPSDGWAWGEEERCEPHRCRDRRQDDRASRARQGNANRLRPWMLLAALLLVSVQQVNGIIVADAHQEREDRGH